MLDIQREATEHMRLEIHYFLNPGVSPGPRRMAYLEHLIEN
jgi:hypothetical protein